MKTLCHLPEDLRTEHANLCIWLAMAQCGAEYKTCEYYLNYRRMLDIEHEAISLERANRKALAA